MFRSKAALLLGWIWMAFAALNTVDLILRYRGSASAIAAVVLAVLTVLVFVTCLRPAIILTEDGVLVRNPLRNTFVPWSQVEEVTVSHSIKITAGGRSVRCWTPQASGRERATAARRARPVSARGRYRTEPARPKGEQAAAEALAGKTHADWVGEQITERAEAARRTAAAQALQAASTVPETGEPEPVKVTWAPTALAALLAALILAGLFLVTV